MTDLLYVLYRKATAGNEIHALGKHSAIAAMDFFTVPNAHLWCSVLLFRYYHDRRKILRFNVTRNPNAFWVAQQLREAWAYKLPHRFLLFDRDSKFGADVVSAVRDVGRQPTRTAFRSPWQRYR